MRNKAFTPAPKILVRGFTLLELVVVVIILGILATLGLTQYGRMVERARGAEARQILGHVRDLAAGFWIMAGAFNTFDPENANIGSAQDQIPDECRSSHYFYYYINPPLLCGMPGRFNCLDLIATRCISGGKAPQGSVEGTLILRINAKTGDDTWSGTGGY